MIYRNIYQTVKWQREDPSLWKSAWAVLQVMEWQMGTEDTKKSNLA